MPILVVFYHLAVAFWVGGSVLFTFVLTPIIFRAYDRDVAGGIVGHLFPAYFRWGLGCGGVGLLALLAARGEHFALSVVILLIMLALTALEAFYMEPRAAALKREIPSFVTTPKGHPQRRAFSRLHAISAVANLAVVTGGVVLVVFF
jgi:hypothetical protein